MKFCLAVLVAIVVVVEAVEFGKPGKCPSPLAMFCLPEKSAPDTCQSDLDCQGSDKCCYACGSRSCHTMANFKGQYLSLKELFKTVSTPKPKEHAVSFEELFKTVSTPKPKEHAVSFEELFKTVSTPKPKEHADFNGMISTKVAVEAVEFGKPGKCPSPLAMFCLPGESAPDTCQSDLYCQGSDKCCYACGSRSCHTIANFKGQYLSFEELFKTVSTPKPKEHAGSCRSTWADFCMPGNHAQDTCKSDSDCHLSEKCCTVCGIRGCDRPVNNHLPTPSPTPIPGQVSKTGSNFENLMKMLLNC